MRVGDIQGGEWHGGMQPVPGGKVLAGDGTNVRVSLPRMPGAFVFGARLTRPLHDRPGPGECNVRFL